MIGHRLENNFPKRYLKITRIGKKTSFKSILNEISSSILFLLVVIILNSIIYSLAYGIIKDRKLMDNYVIADNATIDGKCSSKVFLSMCDVTISKNDTVVEVEHSFYFFDLITDGYDVRTIVQKDDPNNLSVDLAINKMTNRVVTLVFLIICSVPITFLLFYLPIATIRKNFQKYQLKRIMNNPINQPWQFIALCVNGYTMSSNSATYTTNIGEKSVTMVVDFNDYDPIILSQQANKIQLLGIKAKNEDSYVVVCGQFSNINLTKTERDILLDSIAR